MTDGNGVRVRVTPTSVDGAPPGGQVELSVDVYNATNIIDGFDLAVVGLDQAESVEYQPKNISLFPDTEEHIDLKVTIPETYASGNHTLAVRITSKTNPEVYSYQEIPLNVKASPEPSMTVDPEKLTAGRRGRFAVTVRNDGGAPLDVRLTGDDPENHLSFKFRNERITVDRGNQISSQMTVTGRRPFAGDPTTRLVKIIATGGETSLEQTVTLVQRPWIPRVVITLGLVLGLLGVWAVIVGAAIDKILDDTDTDLAASITKGVDDVLDQLAPTATDSAGGAATDIGGTVGPVPEGEGGVVRGRVAVFTTDEEIDPVFIAGATVSAFPLNSDDEIDEKRDPIVGITNDAGSYKISDMGRGRYRLMVSAPGYQPIWIGNPTDAIPNATHAMIPTTIPTFQGVDVLDIPWSGTRRNITLVVAPGSVSGSVATAENNDGTTIQLSRVDGTGLATEPAVMFTVITGKSGTFRFPCADADTPTVAGGDASCSPPLTPRGKSATPEPLPLQPGTYLLTIAKPGFISQQLTTEVTPGSVLTGMDIALVAAAGAFSASGAITSGGVGVAGVAVEVSGANSIKTVTDADGKYSFSVTTPGVYNIVFSKPGFVSTATEVSIGDSDAPTTIPDLEISAEPVTATGRVANRAGVSLEGVSVFTSNDPGWCATEDTATATQTGAGGTFLLPDVRLGPGTLCFTKTGYAPAWVAYVAVPGKTIEGIEIVMYELVTVVGQVSIAGVADITQPREGFDQVSVVATHQLSACEQPGSSYQSVVFSGSELLKVGVLLSITLDDPEVRDPLPTQLRIWDPTMPDEPVAEAALEIDVTNIDPVHEGFYEYDLSATADVRVEPGRVYLIEWDSMGTDARWIRSADGEDPYPTGRSAECELVRSPSLELVSSQDFDFRTTTAIATGLVGATISVDEIEGAVSGTNGAFEMIVASGPRLVTVSHPDYEPTVVNVDFVAGSVSTLEGLSFSVMGTPGSLEGTITCGVLCEQPISLAVTVNGNALDPAVVDTGTGAFKISNLATPSRVVLSTGSSSWSYIVGAAETKDVGEIVRLLL